MELIVTDVSIIIQTNEGDSIEYDKLDNKVYFQVCGMSYDELAKVLKTLKREVKKFKKTNFEL